MSAHRHPSDTFAAGLSRSGLDGAHLPPVLLTSAVHVSAPHTAVTDAASRRDAVIRSLHEWAASAGARRLVVCDGSGFDFSEAASRLMDQHPGLHIECLSFHNDAHKVAQFGKGFGEGEIVNHALARSDMLAQAGAFAKCTGKLWVTNYLQCCRHFNGRAAFLQGGKLRVGYIDTRFYMVSMEFYAARLAHAHASVRDREDHFLEHAFAQALHGLKSHEIGIWPPPSIEGVSGTFGTPYTNSRADRVRLWMRCMSYFVVPRAIG